MLLISFCAGGVLVLLAADPTIQNCHITDCKDFACKVMGNASPTFEDCKIYDIKVCFDAEGPYVYQSASMSVSNVKIEVCPNGPMH